MRPLPCDRLKIKDLRYFVAVADASAIRKAAAQLGVAQPAVSRRLRDLETELGVSLFERNSAGVRLTLAGKRLLEGIRLTFSYLDATVRAVRATGDVSDERLCIGVQASISSSFLNRLLRQWRDQHGKVEIAITEGSTIENMSAVLSRDLDLAFMTGMRAPVGCDVECLWSEPVLAALSIDHPLAASASLEMAELVGESFIVSRQAAGPEMHDYIVDHLSAPGARPKIAEYGVGRETLLSMVGLRFGITLVSGAETEVRYPSVVFVPIAGKTLPFCALWSSANSNPALSSFLHAARKMAGK